MDLTVSLPSKRILRLMMQRRIKLDCRMIYLCHFKDYMELHCLHGPRYIKPALNKIKIATTSKTHSFRQSNSTATSKTHSFRQSSSTATPTRFNGYSSATRDKRKATSSGLDSQLTKQTNTATDDATQDQA